MAKKTAAKKPVTKKPRRRLKRTARRSLAAVLMITAVVVAAIPVPENAAADPVTVAENMTRAGDVHKLDGSKSYSTKPYKYAPTTNDDVSLGVDTTNFDLSTYAGKTDTELVTILNQANSPLKASYYVANPQGKTYSLGWQFMYYEVKNPRGGLTAGAICKYNTEYYTDEVKLDLFPNTEYFVATQDEIDTYYAGPQSTANAAGLLFDNADLKIKKGSQVLHTMDNNPTTAETVYTYSRFDNANGGNDDEVTAYLAKYPSITAAFNTKIAEYQKYRKDLNDYNTGASTVNPGTQPEAFKITPSKDLSEPEKLVYFCEHNLDLGKDSGFYLVPAKDNRPGIKQGDIFLAQYQGSGETDLNIDELKFRVLKTSDYQMCAIANKAFYQVGNIKNINIPGQIGYIGDDAFAGSKLEGVTFDNVTVIGNRAFKDCVVLSTAVLELTTERVGAECFSGTKIQAVKFGSGLRQIGYGAFSNCRSLTTVGFESNGQQAAINGYAFYNCPKLTSVDMEGANIRKFGDAVFATEAGSEPMGFTLPTILSDPNGLGDYLFAGRSSLQYVVFPAGYGASSGEKAEIPQAMFHGCSLLEYVVFPADYKNNRFACGFVSYDPKVLFADVITDDFYVRGPELNDQGDYAAPRKCTWIANTAVSNVIPYVYTDKDGNEFYEVSDGYYLLSIDNKGILRSCTLSPNPASTEPWDGKLEIPAEVGGTKVVGIASDCFKDSALNEQVVSLKIADGSIEKIDAGVFKGGTGDNAKDWLKLKKVYIGDSVKEIGASAFEGCAALVDVTFSSPSFDHKEFKVGGDAFKTGSTELTFHGDIVQGYAPFDWAMAPDNIIDKDRKDSAGNSISDGIRVCYKSMAPTYITVMYNPITEMVTMLDYPKADQVESILAELHDVSDYNSYREQVLYDFYADSRYNESREKFANAWSAVQSGSDEDKEAVYASDSYGPWVNPTFVSEWKNYVTGTPVTPPTTSDSTTGTGSTPGGDDTSDASTGMFDWLFEPLTVQAAEGDPDAYYAHKGNEYDVLLSQAERGRYRPSTPEEDYLLNAVENIVVPEGVQSIDVYGFVKDLKSDGEEYEGKDKSNAGNTSRYFTDPGSNNKWDAETEKMYTINSIFTSEDGESTTVKSVAGLFSGYYKESKEENPRGNDTIRTVTMSNVKYLPDYAFDNCEQLQSVVLGKDCADIGVAPFRGCKALRSVSNNDYYETDNGIIYSKETDGSYVIEECFASRGNPEIVGQAAVSVSNDAKLTSVSAIKPGAFEDCDVITSVDFGNNNTAGLTEVPKDCFKDCFDLQRVVLPKSVNDIESGAFAAANKLSELTIYGKEVKISGKAFDGDPAKAVTRVRAYEDSAVVRYVKEYGTDYRLQMDDNPLGEQWQVTFMGPDYHIMQQLYDQNGKEIPNPQYVENGGKAIVPKDPEMEGWTFEKWIGTNDVEIGSQIYEDTVFIAQGYSNNGTINGRYMVTYVDQIDGTTFATEFVAPGSDAPDLRAPIHPGYEFEKWNTALTNIQGNTTIVAMYKTVGGTPTSGGTTNTSSGGTTNTPSGGTTNTSNNTTSSSNKSSSSSSSSSSTSSSSTTSGTGVVSMHRVTVVAGSGSGMYATGATVVIAANEPAAGMKFTQWTTESSGVTLNQLTASSTIFTMPDNDVVVIANFEGGSGPAPMPTTPAVVPNANTNSNTGQTTPDNGNTRVDITKPGISNRDLATANVNGSTDNFIVKISETDEATRAVAAALTNKYGTLDNILYYAMDITLWDSTGTTQISDTTGLSVDITIPIPDSLVAYGGNNMAGAVVNGDQLESLNENFTTINGVPCIRFRATHFSPYTIYVDTGNLVEGMLDTTPKTGDPIHPKWFLSLGLACLSMILFLKRDKKKPVKVKKA